MFFNYRINIFLTLTEFVCSEHTVHICFVTVKVGNIHSHINKIKTFIVIHVSRKLRNQDPFYKSNFFYDTNKTNKPISK